MASSTAEAQAELVSSLAPDDIPIKLRCAICSKLAVNAFRLPCCEQAICETCQLSLPASCPVCEHSPLAAEDCNPNKSLRTTIKVFLRTAEKKREANRPKEPQDAATTPSFAATNATPLVKDPAARVNPTSADAVVDGTGLPQVELAAPPRSDVSQTEDTAKTTQTEVGTQPEQVHAKEQESGIVPKPRQESSASDAANGEATEANANTEAVGQNQTISGEAHSGQPGQDYSMNNGFANNNMMFSTPDFNQMQMMMSMQNGMGNNTFGGFPMMGMGMDPMTMQSMYMNGGFQGMGMNGMGGYGGYGGGYGQGSNNNWNGSQSWGFDQNNYNQSGHGMVPSDYGNMNASFQTGYNQGDYGQFNDHRRNHVGRGRGRGRGRGQYSGYGRGGFHQNSAFGNQHGNQQEHGYQSQLGVGQASQGKLASGPLSDDALGGGGKTTGERAMSSAGHGDGEDGQSVEQNTRQDGRAEAIPPSTGQTALHEHEAPGRGGGDESGESGAIRPVLNTPDVPINAPTGPKAMRQGLPNTSLHHLRARGYQVDGKQAGSKQQQLHLQPQEPHLQDPPQSLTVPPPPSQQPPATAAAAAAAAIAAADVDGDEVAEPMPRSRFPDRESEHAGLDSAREPSRGRSVNCEAVVPTSRGMRMSSRRASRSASRKSDRIMPRSRSRSRSHSRSGWSPPRQKRRRSSPAVAVDDDDDDDAKNDSSRRRRARDGRRHVGRGGGDEENGDQHHQGKDGRYFERLRSASPDESRKTGYRDREEREHHVRRERERRRDDAGQKSRDRPHRSRERERERESGRDRRRDRERERPRERDRDRDRDRDRAYERGRDDDHDDDHDANHDGDRGVEHKHRHEHEHEQTRHHGRDRGRDKDRKSRKHRQRDRERGRGEGRRSASPQRVTNPSSGGRSSGAANARATAAAAAAASSSRATADQRNPRDKNTSHRDHHHHQHQHHQQRDAHPHRSGGTGSLDPQAQEREERNRQRLLKEAQRMAGFANLAGSKRAREGGGGGGGGRAARRVSRRGEGFGEDRMKRLEAEREAGRWA